MVKEIEYNTSQMGFNTVLRDWQFKVMQAVWISPNGANSRAVWVKVNQVLEGETISRASVINFLEYLKEMDVISGEERTGKGGHHWVYFPKLDETGFKRYIVDKMIENLMKSFPDETKEAIKKLNQ